MEDEAMAEEARDRALVRPGEKTDDLQRAGLRIIQNPEKFCFGMDAVLLTGWVRVPDDGTVLDLGTGTGIIPLLLSAKTKASHLTGLELQEDMADMAARSVALNRLSDRISIVQGDIRKAGALFAPASFDVVTTNPPYMTGGHGLTNPKDSKAIARHEVCCTLDDVASAAEKLVRPHGHVFMVHRPFRLTEIFLCLTRHHLEPKRMRLVYPFADRDPNMVLLDCVRGGNSGIKVEKPLIVFREKDVYTDEVRDLYGF